MLPLRIRFHNIIGRHWQNWKIRRMWLADPNRPAICPRVGIWTEKSWNRAVTFAREYDAWKSNNAAAPKWVRDYEAKLMSEGGPAAPEPTKN